MDHFDFQKEIEEQKKQLIEQYGEDAADLHWSGEDYYDGENINPPSYRWYHHVVKIGRATLISVTALVDGALSGAII